MTFSRWLSNVAQCNGVQPSDGLIELIKDEYLV